MKQLLTTILCILTLSIAFGSGIKGTISNPEGEPLPFSNIYVQGTTKGTTSNSLGEYSLELEEASYQIVFQFVGYQEKIIEVSVGKEYTLLDVELIPESILLNQVTVNANAEDPAYRVIREAIKKRKYYLNLLEGYSCDVYIKGNQKLLDAPEKIFGQEIGDLGGSLDSNRQGIVYLSESISKLHYKQPNQFKEVMTSSKVSGNDNGFSFNQANQMNFNPYEPSIELGRKIISPIAPSAFTFYKYRLDGTFYDKDGRLVNKIEVIPKKVYDPVVSGYIYIVEDLWNFHSIDLKASKEATKIPVVEELGLKQLYVPVEKDIWVLFSQSISFRIKVIGFDIDGNFTGVFSNYEINPEFEKGFFTNEILTVQEESNKKDAVYWDTIRPIPLTAEESTDYVRKDSIKEVRSTKVYLDSVDQKNNRFKPLQLFTGYTYNKSFEKLSIEVESPINTIQFNAVQGFNIALNTSIRKNQDEIFARWWEISPSLNFGFSDNTLRGKLDFRYNFNRVNFSRLQIGGGYMAEQFLENAISPTLNTIYSLFPKDNYMKLYDRIFGYVAYRQELSNGIFFQSNLSYSDRRPLFNNTNYSFSNKEEIYESNNPMDPEMPADFFDRHQALILSVAFRFRINQNYLKYPDRKFIMGSKWPDLWVRYRRGVPVAGSEADFDHLSLELRDRIELGLVGTSYFDVEGGFFLSDKRLEFVDFKHFYGNQTIFANPDRYRTSFQLLPYYQNSTGNNYFQAHFNHYFQGFIWNKIPGLKKLGFQVVGGAHYLYTSERSSYFEFNVGIDNIGWKIFRFLRVDFVAGTDFEGGLEPGFVIGFKIPGG